MADTTVFIACGDSTYAAALSIGLPAHAAVQVTGMSDEASADEQEDGRADVLIVTTDLPDWQEAVERLSLEHSVLVVDEELDAKTMVDAVEAGALGYVSREASFRELGSAVETVGAATPVIPPEMLGALLRRSVDRRREQRREIERLNALTAREREVFEGLARGQDKDEIAAELFISPQTVRTHKQRMFRKLGLHSAAEVVAMAARCGLDVGRTE